MPQRSRASSADAPRARLAPRYLAGVDGGGSGTRVRLQDALGRCTAGVGSAGPSSLSQGVAQAWRHVLEALDAAFADAGLAAVPPGEIAIGLGLAGAENPRQRQAFLAADPGFARCALFTDAQTTLHGAFGGGAGVVVAAGTGSIALAKGLDGAECRAGGWGFPSGDEGGGAWLGLHAMRIAQAALDGRTTAGALAHAVWRQAGADMPALLQWCLTAGQRQYAQLAPLVFNAAEQGDEAAGALLHAAAAELERLLHAVCAKAAGGAGLPIVLTGSIGERLRAFWPDALQGRCRQALGDSAQGALELLRAQLQQDGAGHRPGSMP
ncbi:MAG: ATPase [Burkholderiales bacterium]|nr:ATPase [Burkholderiales bacterium]